MAYTEKMDRVFPRTGPEIVADEQLVRQLAGKTNKEWDEKQRSEEFRALRRERWLDRTVQPLRF